MRYQEIVGGEATDKSRRRVREFSVPEMVRMWYKGEGRVNRKERRRNVKIERERESGRVEEERDGKRRNGDGTSKRQAKGAPHLPSNTRSTSCSAWAF